MFIHNQRFLFPLIAHIDPPTKLNRETSDNLFQAA